jgi:hypothetical protein
MTLTSFRTTNSLSNENTITSAEQLGERIIIALQHESSIEYVNLFPSLEAFHHLMNLNGDVYGPYLSEAKSDFEREYKEILVPSVHKSFQEILRSGKERGIEWSEIKFNSVEFKQENKNGLTVPGIISFSYKGTVFQLRVEKAIVLQDNWQVGRYLHLL